MILEIILITLSGIALFLTILLFRMATNIHNNKCCDHQDKYNSLVKSLDCLHNNSNFWGREITKISHAQYKNEESQKDLQEKIKALIFYLKLEWVPKSLVEKEAHFKQCERAE